MANQSDQDNKKRYWLDSSVNIDKLYRYFSIACIAIALIDVLDLVGVLYHKHPHYAAEKIPGFYAIFGFAAYALIVVAGFVWRKVVMREEDYYDR